MGELVQQFEQLREQIERASKLLHAKSTPRTSRKQLARSLSAGALELAKQSVQLAKQAEALGTENRNLAARVAQLEGAQTTTEPVI